MVSGSPAALMIFPGHNYLRSGFYFRAFNLIYNFMKKPFVDVLVLSTGTFFNYCSREERDRISASLSSGLPLVSLEQEVPGAVNLLIDNQTGIKRCVEHLVLKHRCRRIGFIKGPDGNDEARMRYGAYLEALEDFGLETPPDGIFSGNFIRFSGAEAVRGREQFIKKNLDGLVCCNDFMAIGAIDALRAAGVSVPGDLAVTGFDDLEEARFQRVPLTTVHQPLVSIGRRAAARGLELLDRAETESCPGETEIFLADLRVRGSCGCSPAREKQVFLEKYSDLLMKRSLLDDYIRKELSPHLREDDVARISGEVFHIIRELMEDPPNEEAVTLLLDRLDRLITTEIHDRGIELDWQELISLVHTVSRKLSPRHLLWSHYDFFQRARIIAGDKMEQFQGLKRIRQERDLAEPLRIFSGELLAAQSPEQLYSLCDTHLLPLGIPTCLIALFADGEIASGLFSPYPRYSRLVYALNKGVRLELPAGGVPFETDRFFPERYWRPEPGSSYVLFPLFFRDRVQGVVLFSLSSLGYQANEDIRQMLSAGLFHAGEEGVLIGGTFFSGD